MFKLFNENKTSNPIFIPQLTPVRVIDVILDDKHPDFKGWESIGEIKYKSLKTSANEESSNLPSAFPILPNTKNYPLKNEIVFVISGPSPDTQLSERDEISYYLTVINIWNTPHHNALPDIILNNEDELDYSKVESGFPKLNNNNNDIKLGETFKEQNISSFLLPYEGDYILEGRFGNSIRFGSTVKNPNIKNTWSDNGDDGDPILIITNTKLNNNKYRVEDINKDSSSIYLSETQKIDLNTSNHSQDSFKNESYTKPNQYNNKQIILNSERIVLNSYNDNLLLFSNKSIGLSSLNNLNIDVKNNTIINSNKIYLGLNATEPLLLGNKTLSLFEDVLKDILKVSKSLNKLISIPVGTPFMEVNTTSSELTLTIENALSKLDSLKSKQNFTL